MLGLGGTFSWIGKEIHATEEKASVDGILTSECENESKTILDTSVTLDEKEESLRDFDKDLQGTDGLLTNNSNGDAFQKEEEIKDTSNQMKVEIEEEKENKLEELAADNKDNSFSSEQQSMSYALKADTALNGYVIKTGDQVNIANIQADFIIIQASSGYGGVNTNFHVMADAVLQSGKKLAMYHEGRTGTKEDAHMEAYHFYQTIKNYVGKGLPVLRFVNDIEAGPIWADEFIDTLYGLSGKRGIIWTDQNNLNQGDWDSTKKEYTVMTKVETISQEVWNKGNSYTLPSGVSEMYRMYNPNSGEHFYTKASAERDNLVKAGWRYESIGWTAPGRGELVYRLYNPNAGDHHYTLSAEERDMLIKAGWRYEGTGWSAGGATAIYRLYNPNAVAGAHHFTTSKDEYEWLAKMGWRKEGIAWYGTKSSVPANQFPDKGYLKGDYAYNKNRVKLMGILRVGNELRYYDPVNNGKWKKEGGLTLTKNNHYIYIQSGGALKTGQLKIGQYYKWFFQGNGCMARNQFVTIPGSYNGGIELHAYFNGDGNMLYGTYLLNGKEVMFGSKQEPITSMDSLWIRSNNYLTLEQQKHNASLIWLYFKDFGWSKNAVAALLGNMQAESNINPGLWENQDEGNLNTGYGLVQWTPAQKVIEWLEGNGYAKDSGIGQCARIIYELKNALQYYPTRDYPESFAEFSTSNKSPEYLAQAFIRNYERPYNPNQPVRSEYARFWYNYLV